MLLESDETIKYGLGDAEQHTIVLSLGFSYQQTGVT
jgi:hypothetical protein